MAQGDLMQAVLQSTLHGQTCLNRFHYVATAVPASLTDFATQIDNTLTDQFAAWMSADAHLDFWICQKIYPKPRGFGLITTIDEPGTGPAPACPTAVAAVITKQTAFAGREYRGRTYVAGVPVQFETNSVLNAGATLTLQHIADAMATPLQVNSQAAFLPVVAGYYPKAVNTWVWNNITTCVARNILRSQRRRQVGIGI